MFKKVLNLLGSIILYTMMSFNPVHADRALVSYYGHNDNFGGRKTANGEIFNPYGLTAAHKTLPIGTKVRFTFKGKSVDATINDRGPYSGKREFDLSYGTAKKIGFVATGVGHVEYTVLSKPTNGSTKKMKQQSNIVKPVLSPTKLADTVTDYIYYPFGLWYADNYAITFNNYFSINQEIADAKDSEEKA